MKTLLQYLASWYWERMRLVENKLYVPWDRAEYDLYAYKLICRNRRRKALRLKDKAERLERWARRWE